MIDLAFSMFMLAGVFSMRDSFELVWFYCVSVVGHLGWLFLVFAGFVCFVGCLAYWGDSSAAGVAMVWVLWLAWGSPGWLWVSVQCGIWCGNFQFDAC